MRTECSICQTEVRFRIKHLNQQVKCPGCGRAISIDGEIYGKYVLFGVVWGFLSLCLAVIALSVLL